MHNGTAAPASRSALILYATETGNAQDVAEELGRLVERLRFSSRVTAFDDVGLKDLLHHDLVLFSISTTGQGDLPANAQRFWRLLRSVKLKPGSLQQLRFASFGLGDSSYPQFNYAHRKLYNRLLQLGAQPILERGESDEQHPEGIDGSLVPWLQSLRKCVLDLFPLSHGVEALGEDVPLPPKWTLGLQAGEHQTSPSQPSTVSTPEFLESDVPASDPLPILNTIPVILRFNDRVTSSTHWQDVRHLAFTATEDHAYLPGDVLTIYPKNFPIDVSAFIDVYGWSDIADSPLHLISGSSSDEPLADSPLRNFDLSGTPLTIRFLLTNVLDIMAIPRRSFFSRLAHYTTDEFQRDRLLEFTNPEYIDELYDYTTRPRRSILEVLQEFDTVKLPWQHLLEVLPLMRGRQFSIASGGQLKQAEGGGTKFELLIAIVKYRTVIKKIRQGVCTRYIASLKPGQPLNVKLQRGGLNITEKDVNKPVVMVGPGTGVAPMRALIHERRAWRHQHEGVPSAHSMLRDMLFFGCRNKESDYYFCDEWANLAEEGVLDVHTAFSRDQQRKVYVQDLVRQHSKEVYERLACGIVYICGSSGKMPQAIREALIEVFQKEGDLDRADAEARLTRMEKEGRYKQETW